MSIKDILKVLLKLYLRIKPKKNFYSVSGLLMAFILAEFSKINDFLPNLLSYYFEKIQNKILKEIVQLLISYFQTDFQLLIVLLVLIILFIFFYFRNLELKSFIKFNINSKNGNYYLNYEVKGVEAQKDINVDLLINKILKKTDKQLKIKESQLKIIEKKKGLFNEQYQQLADRVSALETNDDEIRVELLKYIENFNGKKITEYSRTYINALDNFLHGKIDLSVKLLSENNIANEKSLNSKKNLLLLKCRILQFVGKFDEVDSIYKRTLSLLNEEDYKTIIEYAVFLHNQNQYSNSIYYYKKAELLADTPVRKSEVAHNLGILYKENYEFNLAMKQLGVALLIREKQVEFGLKSNITSLINTLNSIGNLHANDSPLINFELAEYYFLRAIELSKKLVKDESTKSNEELIFSLFNYSNLTAKSFKYDYSIKTLKDVLDSIDGLENSSTEKLIRVKALIKHNIGYYHIEKRNFAIGISYLEDAIDILLELFKNNRKRFFVDYSKTLHNLAYGQSELNLYEDTNKNYQLAIKIMKSFMDNKNSKHLLILTNICKDYGEFLFSESGECREGLVQLEKSLDISLALVRKNPRQFSILYAQSLASLASFQTLCFKNYRFAIEYYEKSLEIYYNHIKLTRNTNAVDMKICDICHNIATLYKHLYSKNQDESYRKHSLRYLDKVKAILEKYDQIDKPNGFERALEDLNDKYSYFNYKL
ncbi:hypothetical protein [Winogradskyella sp. PE311]|uniref:hypothetical protein n=1 Tax=Winogradskyella sp. PE311 TaxID=3366943 RepID=UPI00397EE74C